MAGYEGDTATRAVAVPIYQTVAYEFDSAEHAAALFNLEAEGFRYSRISNPTVAVWSGESRKWRAGQGRYALVPAKPPCITPCSPCPM